MPTIVYKVTIKRRGAPESRDRPNIRGHYNRLRVPMFKPRPEKKFKTRNLETRFLLHEQFWAHRVPPLGPQHRVAEPVPSLETHHQQMKGRSNGCGSGLAGIPIREIPRIPGIYATLNSRWEFPGISEFSRNSVGNLREFDWTVNFKQKDTKFKLNHL